jgi:hypothetical protein
MKLLMLVSWVVTSCGPVGRYRRFGGTYSPSSGLQRKWWYLYIQVHMTLQHIRPTSTDKLYVTRDYRGQKPHAVSFCGY